MTGAVVGPEANASSVSVADPAAKGAAGLIRTGNATAGSVAYRLSLAQLTAPYALRAHFDNGAEQFVFVTLATGAGVANMTPLTNLMVAQLYGQEPEAVFNTFNAALAERVTEASLNEAQTKVRALLEGQLGVTVQPGTGDFVTSSFEPRPGDPMFDTIASLLEKIAADGSTLQALTTQVAEAARLCLAEKLTITIAGTAADFCPQSKSATPEVADTTVIAYVFEAAGGEKLTVRARDGSVLTGQYTAGNGDVYSCSGAGCTGIALGTPAGDLTRPLVFSNANWPSAGGNAVRLSGTLRGAIPGVVLPPLPCAVNRFYMVLPDRQVVADCADIPAASAIGLVGTFNVQRGGTRRWLFSFANGVGENGLPPTDRAALHVELEGDQLIGITATRIDPDTDELDIDYKCRGVACNGVTVGPAVVNTDFGFDIELRTITLEGTQLAAVQPDGTLSTAQTALATATLATVGFDTILLNGPPSSDCAAVPQRVVVKTSDDPLDYVYCTQFTIVPPTTTLTSNGGLAFTLSLPNASDALTVETDAAGDVVRVATQLGLYGHSFECTQACSGVTVSAPDGSGQRTITFTDAEMRQLEPDGFATGDRIATANGSYVAPPP
jgi:hypothetical protein